MKIAHVCPFVGEQIGGSERFVYNLSKMQSRKHDVHIFTTTSNFDRVGVSESEGITIHRFYTPIVVWNINPLTLMLKPLMNSNTDLYHIHSHLYFSSNQAVIAKILKKKRTLLQLHGGVGNPPYDVGWFKLAAKQFYDRSLGKFTIKNSNIIASVSKSDLKELASCYRLPETRLRYVPNMVDIDIFKPRSNDSVENRPLIYLGDLEPWKGVGSLIKWIRAIGKSSSYQFTMRFVGQGSYQKNLINLQEHLRKSGNGVSIEVLGQKDHNAIPSLLRESSALVLPSYWEGLPTVILEAMASGIPVISTRVGDVSHLIEHRKTGFLIDRSLDSFQEAIESVLNDNVLVRSMTQKARKLVEREHSVIHAERIMKKIYAEISS